MSCGKCEQVIYDDGELVTWDTDDPECDDGGTHSL